MFGDDKVTILMANLISGHQKTAICYGIFCVRIFAPVRLCNDRFFISFLLLIPINRSECFISKKKITDIMVITGFLNSIRTDIRIFGVYLSYEMRTFSFNDNLRAWGLGVK